MQPEVWEFGVGPEGYTPQIVAFILKDTSVANNTSRLASRLGVRCLEFLLINISAWYHNCSTGDKINNILEIWRVRYPTQALLGVLLYHLIEIDCEEAAEVLEQAIMRMPRIRSRHVSVSTDDVFDPNESDIENVTLLERANTKNEPRVFEDSSVLLNQNKPKLKATFLEDDSAFVSMCPLDERKVRTNKDEPYQATQNTSKRLSGGSPQRHTNFRFQSLVGDMIDYPTALQEVFDIHHSTPHSQNNIKQCDTNLSYGIKLGQKHGRLRKFAEKIIGKTQQGKVVFIWPLIFCATSIILFGLSCFILFHIYTSHRTFAFKTYEPDSSFTKHGKSDKSTVHPEQTHTKRVLHVRSYTDFKNVLSSLSHNQAISLVLHMDNPSRWPEDKKIESIHNIVDVKIVDSYSTEVIHSVLQTMPTLKTLTIVNANYFVCHTEMFSELYDFEKVSLSKLEQLSFQNLNECSGLYKTIASNLILDNLQKLRFANAVIAPNNVDSIQDLLRNARKTLRGLEFSQTTWYADLLKGTLGSFLQLESIEMDFLDDSNPDISYIGENFHRIFPKLKIFKSKFGFISWDQFNILSKGKKVESVELGLQVPESQSIVDLVQLTDWFSNLKELKIFLDFEGKKNANDCKVEGFDKASQKLRKFDCETNCASSADKTRMDKFPTEFKIINKRGIFKSC